MHVDNAAEEFIGPEDMDNLTSSQMKFLLLHTFKADRGEIEVAGVLDSLEDPAPESKAAKTDAFNLEAGHTTEGGDTAISRSYQNSR